MYSEIKFPATHNGGNFIASHTPGFGVRVGMYNDTNSAWMNCGTRATAAGRGGTE